LPFVFCFSIGRWYAVALLSRHSTTLFFLLPQRTSKDGLLCPGIVVILIPVARSQEPGGGSRPWCAWHRQVAHGIHWYYATTDRYTLWS
jgi:hypothetical protein